MTVKNLLVLGLFVCLSATCVGQETGAEGATTETPRTLEDIRSELQQKQSQQSSSPAGMGSGGEGINSMMGGSGYGGGMMGGMAGGLAGGMAGDGDYGGGAMGGYGESMGSMGMMGAMARSSSGSEAFGMGSMGMMGSGMGGMGSMDGMMGAPGGGMMGESSEKQILAQIVQQVRARLNSNKFKREEVEQQLRAALQQYFNADMEERVTKFDKVKARIVDMEAKLQFRLDREGEIIDLQLQQMLHHADGLDFQVPGGESNVSFDPNSIGYDSSFAQTRAHRLAPDALVDYDPLNSYGSGDDSAEFLEPKSDAEKMKGFLSAFHQFHQRFHHFPSSSNRQFANQPPHSWRVAILPLIGHSKLFNEYHFDQPWDSPQNQEFAEKMPELFRTSSNDRATTPFVMLTGDGAFDSRGKATRIHDITDGTSYTIAIIKSDRKVPWTKPEDFLVSQPGPLPELSPGRLVGMVDARVRQLPELKDEEFRALITRAGDEVISDAWLGEPR